MNTPSSQDLHDKLLRREQHLKELLHEAVGWLVEYECTGRFDDRGRKMLRDMIDRGDAAVGNPPNDWAEDDRLAQAKPTSTLLQTRPSGITPPPELVQEWMAATESNDCIGALPTNFEQRICTSAAQWGADTELEACVEWINKQSKIWTSDQLRAARRPKPPSLKKQALAIMSKESWSTEDEDTIRRALEELPE